MVWADNHDRLRAVQPARTLQCPEAHRTAIKLTDLLVTLVDCPKGQSANIDDRCKVDLELNSEPI
jgi:hypothetical protein